MYEVTVEQSFAAAHALRHYKEPAKTSTATISKSTSPSKGNSSTKREC